jgi:hypothetical protein
MDNTETLAILGTQHIRRRQTKQSKKETNKTKQNQKTKQNKEKPHNTQLNTKKMCNTDPSKTQR